MKTDLSVQHFLPPDLLPDAFRQHLQFLRDVFKLFSLTAQFLFYPDPAAHIHKHRLRHISTQLCFAVPPCAVHHFKFFPVFDHSLKFIIGLQILPCQRKIKLVHGPVAQPDRARMIKKTYSIRQLVKGFPDRSRSYPVGPYLRQISDKTHGGKQYNQC